MPRPKGTPKSGGRKKGTPNKATLGKEQAREALRQIVLEQMRELVAAQIANAMGIKYLVARHKGSGKFERIGEEDLKALLAGEDSDRVVIEVWDKDPSVQAFTDLMNRAIDRPKEQEQDVNVKHDGRLEIVIKKPW